MATLPQDDSSSDSESDFFSVGQELVPPRDLKPAAETELNFDGLLSTPLRLHEDLAKGCGGQLWPAGIRLAKYLLRSKRDELKNASIVELGSGGGLTGLAVAMGCQNQQTLHITDQEVMYDLMVKNIRLNNLQDRVTATIYDWGTPTPAPLPAHPDIILAADCVYFEPAFEPLRATLKDLIGENTTCYFCYKKRRRADLHFIKAAKKTFNVLEVKDDPEYQEYSRQNVHLYIMTKRTDTRVRDETI